MLLGFLCAIGIMGNLVCDYRNHNKKILGTDKDIFKDNPMDQRNAQACEEIYARARKEYEERTGKKADW